MEPKERIKEVINYLKKTPKRLAEDIGYTHPQKFYDILNGKTKSITSDVAFKIISKYPEINRIWLLTGEGNMLKGTVKNITSNEEGNYRLVPLINIDSVGGMDSRNDITDTAQYAEKLVPFEKAQEGDIAIYQSGESMSPTIPPGSVMLLRRVTGWREYFGYGEIFVVLLTDGRRITKEINRSQTDERKNVLCVSHNPDYPNEELPRAMIADVWKVIKILTDIGW